MKRLRILLVHNHYQQFGGEDRVFEAELALLEGNGHAVATYTRHNDEVAELGNLSVARKTIWNQRTFTEVREIVRQHRADIVHVHNTLPLVSPAAHHAAKAEGAAVVQTLHNFRLYCPSSEFWRDGLPCEDCKGKAVPVPGIVHACYRKSRAATGTVAAMMAVHRAVGTWTRKVDRFIAPSEFARQKLIACGLTSEAIVAKHHFVTDAGVGDGSAGNALFVGRLAPVKGLRTLIDASARIGARLPLTIVGTGPLEKVVRDAAEQYPWIEWLGEKPPDEVRHLMGLARVVVVPSEFYETFGLVAAESLSKGTPVIASRRGALTEIVSHGVTGLLFQPGDVDDLAARLGRFCDELPEQQRMRRAARAKYETSFAPDANYELLLDIYRQALDVPRAPAS